jgi:Flp pilus assembly protein CpaB
MFSLVRADSGVARKKERKHMSSTLTGKVSGRMSSRGWAIALGVGAIVLAAILLIVYLDRYRARVSGENTPTPVLVAKQLIPAGTPGTLAASGAMYTATTLPRKDAVVGAITDPSYLAGRAAAKDVFPGAQITAADFSATDTGTVSSRLRGAERAISVSVDNVHGSLSQLQAGDSIDLYTTVGSRSGQGVVKLFQPNVTVLAVPAQTGPSGGSNLILKINTADAAKFAYAADNTQFYFVLRPVVGAKPTARTAATAASILG